MFDFLLPLESSAYCRGWEKAQVGTGARTPSLHLSQTLQWLQANFSLELCRNTKQWHLTLSVYTSIFISLFFPPPSSQAVTDTLTVPVVVDFAALTLLIGKGHNTDVSMFSILETMLNHNAFKVCVLYRGSHSAWHFCFYQWLFMMSVQFRSVSLHWDTILSSHTDPSSYSSRWWALKVLVCKLLWERWHIYDEQREPSSLDTAKRGRFPARGAQHSAVHCGFPSEGP